MTVSSVGGLKRFGENEDLDQYGRNVTDAAIDSIKNHDSHILLSDLTENESIKTWLAWFENVFEVELDEKNYNGYSKREVLAEAKVRIEASRNVQANETIKPRCKTSKIIFAIAFIAMTIFAYDIFKRIDSFVASHHDIHVSK